MVVQPYLMFAGNCAEAVEFYRTAVGAEVGHVAKYKDVPDPRMVRPGMAEQVMHVQFKVGQSVVLASDGCEAGGFAGFSLAVTVDTTEKADATFAALAAGGSVQMPLAPTFWSPKFGMLTDRFGVAWMVMVSGG